jgi:4-amino-4-deoxy-L-arabinose transferase-like glycosyltransferase
MGQLSTNWKDKHFLLLILALLVGFFARTYRLADTFDFNGDLGRDALVAKRIIVDHKLTLIGPRASGGDFYLGPFYYYFIIPSLLLAGFSPLGPVYLTVAINLLTIVLVYFVSSKLFSKTAGSVAALLYATSPLAVTYGRGSGNYAALPFLGLLAVYLLWMWLKERKLWLMIFLALTLGLAIQMHYSVVVLAFFGLLCLVANKINPLAYWKQFLAAMLVFGALCSPILFFDLRHNWVNVRGLANYLLGNSGDEIRALLGAPAWSFTGSLSFFTKTILSLISPVLSQGLLFPVAVLVSALSILIVRKQLARQHFYLLALIVFATIFSSFYKGYLADYYFIFIFTIPIIFFASIISLGKKTISCVLLAFVVVALSLSNLKMIRIKTSDRSLAKITNVAEIIASDAPGGSNFNLFLKRETPFWSTASEYRYLTEIFGKRALGPTEYRQADILYYIDETDEGKPLSSQNWEVTEFSPKQVVKNWQIGNINIYKLSR